MINREPKRAAGFLALGAMAAAVVLGGCSEEPVAKKAAPPPPPPAEPPPPPPPAVKTVASLMAELGIDDRVRMEESAAPGSTEERVAMLEFFDAFARGDDGALRPMLPILEELELDALVESGEWSETVENIYDIEVVAGTSPNGDKCVMALIDVNSVMQPQLWHYFNDAGGFEFEAQPCPPDVMDKLSGTDWIAAWYDLLDKELALADRDDVDVEWDPVDLDQSNGNSGSGFSPSPGGNPSSAPSPGGPGRRRPTPPPRKPPGPPG